jgi:signal recognition particle receptor subunit beta
MAWSSPDSWATRLFSGDPWIILLAFVTTLALPVLLHLYFYTSSARTALTPTFLLLGPSGSGKTSLLTLVSKPGLFLTYMLTRE